MHRVQRLREACPHEPSILPLAITMRAGPQIMSAIVFVTSTQALRNSLAFVTGVLVATAIGVALILGLQSLLGIDLGDPDDNTSTGHIIQYVLIAAAIRNYVRRATIKPPKRLGKLQGSGPLHRAPDRPARDPAHALGHHRDDDHLDQPPA